MRLRISIILLCVACIGISGEVMGQGQGSSFTERLATSSAAGTLSSRGIHPTWSQRTLVDMPNGAPGVRVPVTDDEAVFLTFSGDTSTATSFDGFVAGPVPSSESSVVTVESLDGTKTIQIDHTTTTEEPVELIEASPGASTQLWDVYFKTDGTVISWGCFKLCHGDPDCLARCGSQ